MGTKLHKKSKTYFKIGEKLLFELSCIPHYSIISTQIALII